MPPAALISSTAIWPPASELIPYMDMAPLIEWINPTTTGFFSCACRGAAMPIVSTIKIVVMTAKIETGRMEPSFSLEIHSP
jgi:hypothetical protein